MLIIKNVFPIFFLQVVYRNVCDRDHWVNLGCTPCCSDTFTYCDVITIVVLIGTSSTSHNYHFFLVVEIILFWSVNTFDDYNTMFLSTFTLLSIRSHRSYLQLLANLSP